MILSRPLSSLARRSGYRGAMILESYSTGPTRLRPLAASVRSGQRTSISLALASGSADFIRQQRRWHTAPASRSQVYDFEQIKQISGNPTKDRVLIDVREPSEFKEGTIPTSVNVPIKSAPDALFMPADEFEDRFGSPKPRHDQEVVFFCKAGVRSSAAAKLAEQVGYEKISEYRGSWLDWEKNGGKKEIPKH